MWALFYDRCIRLWLTVGLSIISSIQLLNLDIFDTIVKHFKAIHLMIE